MTTYLNSNNLLIIPYVRVLEGAYNPKNRGQNVVNVSEAKTAEKYATRARNVARRVAYYSPLGYMARLEFREELSQKIKACDEEANTLNNTLQTCQILHHTLITEVTTTPLLASAVYLDVAARLGQLRDCARFRTNDFENVFLQTRPILSLICNDAYFSVEASLSEARELYKSKNEKRLSPVMDKAINLFSEAGS